VIGPNLRGTYFITTAFAKALIGAGRTGCVINIASVHGLVGAVDRSLYGVSKGGLIQMTRLLAIEWADKGIRVNAVAPGRLDTESPSRLTTASDPAYMQAMLKRIPLQRMTTADEIAAAVAFLASAKAASITGQVLVMDGGLTAA
jgi:2-deoxy-D-gluconate 3-dehydrogenase